MSDNLEELGKAKVSLKSQEISWRQRMYPIPKLNDNSVWRDKKGNYHMHVCVNESDGVFRLLEPQKIIPIDKCVKCNGRISIDAKNVWDLNKRRTISALFGQDTTFTLLLIIMGIIAVGALGFTFYLYGQNSTLQTQLTEYKNLLNPAIKDVTPKLLLAWLV